MTKIEWLLRLGLQLGLPKEGIYSNLNSSVTTDIILYSVTSPTTVQTTVQIYYYGNGALSF